MTTFFEKKKSLPSDTSLMILNVNFPFDNFMNKNHIEIEGKENKERNYDMEKYLEIYSDLLVKKFEEKLNKK